MTQEETISRITRKIASRLAADHERQSLDVIFLSQNPTFIESWKACFEPLLTLDDAADSIYMIDNLEELGNRLSRRNDPMLIVDLSITNTVPIGHLHAALDRLHAVASLNIISHERDADTFAAFGDEFMVDDYRWGEPDQIIAASMVRSAREKIYLRNRLIAGEGSMNSEERLRKLNRIGLAFSRERDLTSLLNLVLRECRELLNADAGSIYILEAPSNRGNTGRRVLGRARRKSKASAVRLTSMVEFELKGWSLRFAAAQNDSVHIPFKDVSFPANMESIAGFSVMRGETLNIPDVYATGESKPYTFNRKIDSEYGYRCVSMLSVPMVNMRDEIVGVIQLMNRKRDPLQILDDPVLTPDRVLPFDDDDLELARVLGTQAGAAIDNVRLYDSISTLFEGFVTATVRSIEQRDPSTAGHSARVDRLTLAIADEINRAEEGPYADISFNEEEMVELHYAALLHDVGKIGVREHVLTKANKLFPDERERVKLRAELIATALHLRATESLREAVEKGEGRVPTDLRDEIEGEHQRLSERLAADLGFVLEVNSPGYMSDEKLQQLDNVYNRTYPVADGLPNRLINEAEYHALSIRRGSLSDEERLEMQSHVSNSRTFLAQIPWTPELSHVPQIAGQHHEKINGQGYPDGIPALETPLQARIMAVADVFDSLTSADRPYKPAIPLERALQILQAMSDNGELDPDIVDLFNKEQMWVKLNLKVVKMSDATDAQRNAQ